MRWNRALVGVLAAIPVVALLGFGMTRDPKEIASPLPGREVPPFKLDVFTVDSGAPKIGTFDVARYKGDVVVVNFWASWCLACRDEHPALHTIGKMYRGTDVHFVGILYNDVATNGRRWIEEMGGESYPSLLDPGGRAAIDFGVYGVPETYFIGRDGRVAFKQTGPVTEELLMKKIEELRQTSATATTVGTTGGAP